MENLLQGMESYGTISISVVTHFRDVLVRIPATVKIQTFGSIGKILSDITA